MSESGPGPTEHEELVPEDDRIIGVALRWSLVALGAIGVVALAAVFLLREPAEEAEAVAERALLPPAALVQAAPPPPVRFTEVTEAAGIDFVHQNGADGRKLLPETMGGGCAFLDYDSDGDPDLLFVDSRRGDGSGAVVLYRNDGTGRFRDATRVAGLDVEAYGMGVAVGDYDSDGDPDVFVTAVGSNILLRNDDGRFVDVTRDAGVGGDPKEWSSSAAFFDADNDGDLDLFVCNYVRWSPEIDLEVDYQLTGIGRAYGPPTNFRGADSYFYLNDGNGRFQEVSESAGIRVRNPATDLPMGKALAVLPVDYDEDGDVDLLVANDTVQNFLFRNEGDATFEEVGAVSGAAYDTNGKATGAMGIDAAYFRNDDELAIAIGNFSNEMTSFYVTRVGSGLFADDAVPEGIGPSSRERLTFGLFFFDYDLDGRLDLLQANGHIEEDISIVQASQSYRQPAQLYWNCGSDAARGFCPVDASAMGDLSRPIVGRGAAYADIDADGDLDVLLTQVAGPPLLLRNDQEIGHHWLRVVLEGTESNREGIGARVELETAAGTQRQVVMPARSYLSSVELPLTFGLGKEPEIRSLRVVWPSGHVQEVTPPQPDQVVVVREEPGATG